MDNIQAIDKFNKFAFNYNHNFISEVFTGSLVKHLQSEFDNLYERHGSKCVMLCFYFHLDEGNKKKLIEYILNK